MSTSYFPPFFPFLEIAISSILLLIFVEAGEDFNIHSTKKIINQNLATHDVKR